MDETEYDIIDELYFVTSYQDLEKALSLEPLALQAGLLNLLQKGFVKCFYPNPDQEIDFEEKSFALDYQKYYYLATKAGLINHNSR